MLIAIAGKGGVGKTTLTAALTRLLQSMGAKNFCVVDADPVGVLGRLLGAENRPSVAQSADQFKGMDTEFYDGLLVPLPEGGHLLRMGYPKSPGCFCRVNGLTKLVIAHVRDRFPIVLMDNEAGLEHVTRGTSEGVDQLILVADKSRAALEVARETLETARSIGQLRGQAYLVVRGGSIAEDRHSAIDRAAEEMGLPNPHWLPNDERIAEAQMTGEPLPAFSEEIALYSAVRELAMKSILVRGERGGNNVVRKL
jgi:CO dehydrogenase maturation factor